MLCLLPLDCLLNGLDDIGLTMEKMDTIRAFETERSARFPWLDGATTRVPALWAVQESEMPADTPSHQLSTSLACQPKPLTLRCLCCSTLLLVQPVLRPGGNCAPNFPLRPDIPTPAEWRAEVLAQFAARKKQAV